VGVSSDSQDTWTLSSRVLGPRIRAKSPVKCGRFGKKASLPRGDLISGPGVDMGEAEELPLIWEIFLVTSVYLMLSG